MAPHSLPLRSPTLRARSLALVANILVVCFTCIGTLERIYDVVLQLGLWAGAVGTFASWFAISWLGGRVNSRKFCEGSAKATLHRVLEHIHISGQVLQKQAASAFLFALDILPQLLCPSSYCKHTPRSHSKGTSHGENLSAQDLSTTA
jgi:hypothetical protein